jgi:hypothetical protein
MRSFVLALLLLSLGAAALVLIAINAAAGDYSDAALREFDTVYEVLGWYKYGAGLLLLFIADRAVFWRERVGWRRAFLLWTPLLVFCFHSYLQWGLLGDARMHYLQRHGQWAGGFNGALIVMAFVWPLALAVTAVNYLLVRHRMLRLTTLGLRKEA